MRMGSIAALAVLSLAASASAALQYTGGTSVINFDQNIGFGGQWSTATSSSVFKVRTSGSGADAGHISEPTEWYWGGDMSKNSLSSYSWDFLDNPPQVVAPFTADYNNNGFTDSRRDLFQLNTIDSTVFPALGSGNQAMMFTQDTWQDKRLTLAIDNTTGAALTGLHFAVDTWFNDTGKNTATFSLRWGTSYDGSQLPNVIGSRVGTKTSAGWSSLETIAGDASLSVPAGGRVYLQFDYDQSSQGTAFAFDNITIGAVPEPGMLGLLGLTGLLAMRRRK